MKCHAFDELVVDLLRGELAERERAQALKHALGCASCAARLDRGRTLHAALHELAGSSSDQQTPPAVEQALVEAFRKEVARPSWRRAVGRQDTRATAGLLAGRRAWFLAASVAAMVVVAVVGVWWLGLRPAPGRVRPAAAQAEASAPTASKPAPQTAANREKHRVPVRRLGPASARPATRRPSPPPLAAAGEPAEAAAELTTDFIALPFATRLRPDEMAQVVRVRVPRSALVRYGLPVSGERIGEPVSADFVLGEDGMARAVRLVHEIRFADVKGGSVRPTRLPR